MKIKLDYSPNFSKKSRKLKDIKFIIIHYTGMQSEIESTLRLKDQRHKVSTHYLISRRGVVTQMVKDNKIAWHAGKSRWRNYYNLNKFSIGIELVNKGHQFGYEKFPKTQIVSLINICKKLKKKYNIKSPNFLGHSDIAPLRKSDPGEKFPWKTLSMHNLGYWYEKKSNKFKEFDNQKKTKQFFENLFKIGYRYFKISERKKQRDKLIIKAFQRRYLPNKVSGKIDKKTLFISDYLAKVKKIS